PERGSASLSCWIVLGVAHQNANPPHSLLRARRERPRRRHERGLSSQETSECQYSPLTRLEFASAWIGRISGCPSGPGVFGWMCNSPKYRPSLLWDSTSRG